MQPTDRDKQMLNEHDADISTRVTRVEAEVETLTGTMNEVSTSIKQIERSIAAVGKTDMKTLMTIAGSVVTVALTIWAILVAPINQQIGDMKEDLAKIDRMISLYSTLPADMIRTEQKTDKNMDRMEAMERREAAASERSKFLEELVKELGTREVARSKK